MPSTVISSYTYIPESEILQIKFVSGNIYNYLNVPLHVYQAMKESFSKGIFFNENIKEQYEFERVAENKRGKPSLF